MLKLITLFSVSNSFKSRQKSLIKIMFKFYNFDKQNNFFKYKKRTNKTASNSM